MKFAVLVLVLCLCTFAVQPNSVAAASQSITNNTPAVVDGSSEPRTFDVAITGNVSKVNVTVDFHKISGADCSAPGPGSAFNDEISYRLTSPSATSIFLVRGHDNPPVTYGNPLAGPRVQVTFDDDAASLPGPAPATGTFKPNESLSTFNGEAATGTWTLTVGDDGGIDVLCHYSATLTVEAADPLPQVVQFFQPQVNAANPTAPILLSASGKDAVTGAATFATVTYSTSGNCSESAGLLTLTGAGDCIVTAVAQATGTHLESPPVQRTVKKLPQAINLNVPAEVPGGTALHASATGGNSSSQVLLTASAPCQSAGLASATPGNNVNIPSTATAIFSHPGTGACTVIASQAGNAYYDPAPGVQKLVSFKRTQVISVNLPASVKRNTTFGMWAQSHDSVTNVQLNPQPAYTVTSLTPAACSVLPPANAAQKARIQTLNVTNQVCRIRIDAAATATHAASTTMRQFMVVP